MKKQFFWIAAAFACLCVATASARRPAHGRKPDNRPIDRFDLRRYMGHWFEIARYDHRFERGMTHVTTDYKLRSDGTVRVINSGMKDDEPTRIRGRARQPDPNRAGRLKVSFFPFVWSDYFVLDLDSDYEWVLLGSSSPRYLWILSRTPSLPDSTLRHIVGLARKRGYDTDKLIFVDQR